MFYVQHVRCPLKNIKYKIINGGYCFSQKRGMVAYTDVVTLIVFNIVPIRIRTTCSKVNFFRHFVRHTPFVLQYLFDLYVKSNLLYHAKMMSQSGAPILVLNTNTKRKFGHKVQLENIAAGNYFLFFGVETINPCFQM